MATNFWVPYISIQDKQVLFAELHHEYNGKFVYPRIFVPKLDKEVSTETDMDDGDLQSFDQRTGTFQSISQRQSGKFQHLNVPASRYSTSVSSSMNMNMNRRPTRSSATSTEDALSEQGEEDDESEEEEYSDDGTQDYGSDDPGMDPDVDYDEEGEEPKVPHPTNSLRFDSDED